MDTHFRNGTLAGWWELKLIFFSSLASAHIAAYTLLTQFCSIYHTAIVECVFQYWIRHFKVQISSFIHCQDQMEIFSVDQRLVLSSSESSLDWPILSMYELAVRFLNIALQTYYFSTRGLLSWQQFQSGKSYFLYSSNFYYHLSLLPHSL